VTVRLGYVACGYFDADIGLANVRPEHRAFYRKVFLQEPWGEPRLYPGLIKPVGLVAANYREIRETVFQRFPYALKRIRATNAVRGVPAARSRNRFTPVPRLSPSP
jgi:hypothetical protein